MKTLILQQTGPIARVYLNRPEVKNAFNNAMISELMETFKNIEKDTQTRVVILSGKGGCFCAGADLQWMKSFVDASREQNEADASRLADLLSYLNEFPKPIITQVYGAAMGGGVGLVAISDIAIAAEETSFALSEVKLGLIPAVISPFVISKMGVAAARRYFLTGEKFTVSQALFCRLVHEEVDLEELESRAVEIAKEFLSCGPKALAEAKKLIREIEKNPSSARDYTVKKIAELRVSEEGQEGIKSFLEKRKPSWKAST